MTESPAQPRVLFFITVNLQGAGGHFYSLKTIAGVLNRQFPCHIAMLGRVPSPVYEDSPVPRTHVYFNGWNWIAALQSVLRLIREFRPTVLHVFDSYAFGIVRQAARIAGLPCVVTKAGGFNYEYFPVATHQVLFSRENQAHFAKQSKYRNTRITLLPQRAVECEEDMARVAEIRARLDPSRRTFLRIARFNTSQLIGIAQAIQLVKRLNADGAPCQLVLVGTPQVDEVLAKARELADEHVHFFIEDHFTLNASSLLPCADYVVGTGRSLMEASSKGCVLLTPYAGASIPVLVDEDNFTPFFTLNFSPRNKLDNFDEEANYQRILAVVRSPQETERAKQLSRHWFDQEFDISRAVEQYRAVYLDAARVGPGPWRVLDAVANACQTMRRLVRAF